MITIAICEDNPADMTLVRQYVIQSEMDCNITEYTTAEDLLDDLENCNAHYDLYFLDIILPGQNGLSIARRLRLRNDSALVIFLSCSEDYYREAFDVYAFHYLIKPIRAEDFMTVLQKAAITLGRQIAPMLPISFRGRNMRIPQSQIKYISSANHRIHIHMVDGHEYTLYSKLDDLETKLVMPPFVRCHKSYIVNLNRVDRLTPEGFYIGDELVSISRAYTARARAAYHEHLFGVFERV